MKSKVELLAPAGNYTAFLGAINAGADAVYLGGDKFGARAYADNFTTEEVCRAIHTAHFMGRKIYLTVNTLLKDDELAGLYEWLVPFYEEGLDGVIVQDIGVLCYIKDHFKDLPLHASTQMTLTGIGGALFMKEQGVKRIVPARELSLDEVRKIKKESGLELECFIHGAMCYCYSGQCLFSSILGGRSGNRGRCAQPCRLPYQLRKNGERIEGIDYPLSLKDMCTIAYIPELIEAGIDSFKIEGRMKKPEYTAGVTALYRKYIDLYMKKGAAGYHVEQEDMEMLRNLYIRSEIQTGYYEQHNGSGMITLHKPSYSGSDPKLLEQIKLLYLHEPDKLTVKMHITLNAGEPAQLQVSGPRGVSVTVYGENVETARKSPLQYQDIRKQMEKTGNSLVKVSECQITMQDDLFLPVRALNELRRKGVDTFEQQYIMELGMIPDRNSAKESNNGCRTRLTESVIDFKNLSHKDSVRLNQLVEIPAIDVLVSTYDQLVTVVSCSCRRIYIDSDLYLKQYEQIVSIIKKYEDYEYYIALPYVLRERDREYLRKLTELIINDVMIDGFLIRNYEELPYVRKMGNSYKIIPDAGMYIFNTEGMLFWSDYCNEYTLPYELNAREAEQLSHYAHTNNIGTAMIVYGRIPMMITANCIRKTAGHCILEKRTKIHGQIKAKTNVHDQADDMIRRTTEDDIWLKDRYGNDFPVETNCTHCYNIIYNSVPYSLHLQERELARIAADVKRYDFTVESGEECRLILEGGSFPYEKYTTGHVKRGVE